MKFRLVLSAAIVALLAALTFTFEPAVEAQGHPCDATIGSGTQTVTLPSTGSPVSVGFCAPVSDAVTSAHIKFDGVDKFTGSVTAQGVASSSGLLYYVVNNVPTTGLQIGPSNAHQLSVAAVNQGGGEGAVTLVPFVLVTSAPGAPSKVRIGIGL